MSLMALDLSDPQWLAHRFDETTDSIRFLHCTRAERSAAPFLTDDNLPTRAMSERGRADAVAGIAPANTAFIFHSAYCCSTLLANVFDLPGTSTALKEPQILNDMVGWRHRGADPAAVGKVLGDSIALLARPFEVGERVVIKPSNVVNGLASAIFELCPQTPAILLHAPLRTFLTSIARKGMWGRLWVRELLSRQLVDGLVTLGFEPRDHLLHTDLQAAAVGWLAQQQLFAALLARWPGRLRSLNSETLIGEPQASVGAAAMHFGIDLGDEQVAAIVASAFSREAKSGGTFVPGQRDADRQAGEALHAEEIDKVSIWAAAVADRVNVPMDLPLPLVTP
jgi:hypothetical protein